jgi:putative Holliday junction resolvase
MRLAGIDVGLKRIGMAISLDGKIVLPQNAILRKNRKQASREVKQFLEEWAIEKLIVGLPKGGSTQAEMERRIKHFVSLLELKDVEVNYQDEYGSSLEAKEMTKGIFRHRRNGKLDSISAQIILERWLSTHN